MAKWSDGTPMLWYDDPVPANWKRTEAEWAWYCQRRKGSVSMQERLQKFTDLRDAIAEQRANKERAQKNAGSRCKVTGSLCGVDKLPQPCGCSNCLAWA